MANGKLETETATENRERSIVQSNGLSHSVAIVLFAAAVAVAADTVVVIVAVAAA